jgi:hypothetical protein
VFWFQLLDLDFCVTQKNKESDNACDPNAESKTEEETQSFHDKLEDIVQEASRERGREITMGRDFNACVGGTQTEGDGKAERRAVGAFRKQLEKSVRQESHCDGCSNQT